VSGFAPPENRPHASIGYVTPDDEHEGRGDAIRQQRRDGLATARENRIACRRNTTSEENQWPRAACGRVFHRRSGSKSQTHLSAAGGLRLGAPIPITMA
jgi:hypothetical protein